MKRETFIRKKEQELEKYGERMRKTVKRYGSFSRVTAETNNRKGRAAAAGEAVLRALDALCETAAKKNLVQGGVGWLISEEMKKDDNGKKIYTYEVGFSALSTDREYTDEQIKEELNKTWEKMMMEVNERYPEEEGHEKEKG